MELLHRELTQAIIGSFFESYRRLGFGFLEAVYKNALAVEFGVRKLPFAREVPIEVLYRGVPVGTYRCDFLVDNKVFLEIKSQRALTVADERQLLNYLYGTSVEVGLLLNFGPVAKYERRVLANDRKAHLN